jgi:hypothetical protein
MVVRALENRDGTVAVPVPAVVPFGEIAGYDGELALPQYEDDLGPEQEVSQAVRDLLDRRSWRAAVRLAVSEGVRDYGELTNVVFFARHKDLGGRRLDPNVPGDAALMREWAAIRRTEVWPAVQEAVANTALRVSGQLVAERDPTFFAGNGPRFKQLVEEAARDVGLEPAFVAAVCLAETSRDAYFESGGVLSFRTGTDDFHAQRSALRTAVPAFARVRFTLVGTDVNENRRTVNTVRFPTARDAILATAVYLKNGEIKLRAGAAANGGNFDTMAVETRLALTRIAMTAGHGGITPDGTLVHFKRVGTKLVRVKPGETGGVLIGVASRLARALRNEDILIRADEPRRHPTGDARATNRNATILVAQTLHLAEWIFRQPIAATPPAPQPEMAAGDVLDANEVEHEEMEPPEPYAEMYVDAV